MDQKCPLGPAGPVLGPVLRIMDETDEVVYDFDLHENTVLGDLKRAS